MKLFDSISFESIDQQYNNDVFKNQLIAVIAAIYEKIDAGIYKNTYDIVSNEIETKKIVDIIYKRTGIKLHFDKNKKHINEAYRNAMVYFYRFNYLGSLLTIGEKAYFMEYELPKEVAQVEEALKKELDKLKKNETIVNTKTGSISGGYSNIAHDIIVDFYNLYKTDKLTPEEVAAIIMHEVGHCFTWIQFTNKINSLNQALYNIHSIKNKEDKDKVFTLAYTQLKSIDSTITEKQVKNMVEGNIITSSYAYYDFICRNTNLRNLIVSLMAINEDFNKETLADTYAARMGFASALITGMLKSYKHDRIISNIYAIFDTLIIILITAAIAVSGGSLVALSFLLFRFIITLLDVSDNINNQYTYKQIKERFQKIYNEAVDSIKDIDNKDFKREQLQSLRILRGMIDKLPKDAGLLSKIYLALNEDSRYFKAYEYQQDVLEKLASNELFVKAIELELSLKEKK